MIVIHEAEKITGIEATRMVRRMMLTSYIEDPIQSNIRQVSPKGMTVELPGVSLLVPRERSTAMIDALNKLFAYREHLAFISNDDTRSDQTQTISIIKADDKYNMLRVQQTIAGNYITSTACLITRLQQFEIKYPFQFVGVGEDWLILRLNNTPVDSMDLTREFIKVCPPEHEIDITKFSKVLLEPDNRLFMWWD